MHAAPVSEAPGPLYLGLDLGSSRTKVALIDAGRQLRGRAVRKSGIDFAQTARACLDEALHEAGAAIGDVGGAVATGYGRNNVDFVTESTRTEIGCLARGAYQAFGRAITVIDIGGQDNKVVKVDAAGRRESFRMNRKCAAGTGAFLEEMAHRLDVSLAQMDALAREARDMVKLGSYCTVFSATEVLESIRAGRPVPDIVKGIYYSMIKRVLEMDALGEHIVMTGGVVAHNPYLAQMSAELIGRPVLLCEQPQFVGAIGAALHALDEASQPERSDATPEEQT